MLLMCASFPLFSSDPHHCCSSPFASIISLWRLVSCCIHAGKDLMPAQSLMTSLFREEMSLSHSGSPDMMSQLNNSSDWREERCCMPSGKFFIFRHQENFNSWRAEKWWNRFQLWHSLSMIRLVVGVEFQQLLLVCASSSEDITWSLHSIVHWWHFGGHGFNLNLGQLITLNTSSIGNMNSTPSSTGYVVFHSSSLKGSRPKKRVELRLF